MKINWEVRFHNPIFIAQLILSILTPIIGYAGLTLSEITSWAILGGILIQAISNPYVIGLIVISVWNCVNDPTTKGVCDSTRAMNYINPN